MPVLQSASTSLYNQAPYRGMALLMVGGIAIRLIAAAQTGMGVDESYSVSVARFLSLGYLDHPPLHYWIIWLTSHLAGSENALVLRAPFIVMFAGTTWLTFCLGRLLFGERAGFYAALILNLSPVFSLSTGCWTLPDGPLMFFLLLGGLSLAKLLFGSRAGTTAWNWLSVGLWLGLALLSKYYAIFFVLGFLAYATLSHIYRSTLLTVGPYIAATVAILVFSPALIWNYRYGWASFLYQGSRGTPLSLFPGRVALNILGQALWILPWIWAPLLWSLKEALRKPTDEDEPFTMWERRRFLCCMAIGPILFFSLVPLWTGWGLPHWPASGYLFIFPLLGERVAEALQKNNHRVRSWVRNSAVVYVLMLLMLCTQARFGWMTMWMRADLARKDPTLDMLDWTDIQARVESMGVASNGFVMATNWIDAGKIDYALGGRIPVLCLNEHPHHYRFMRDAAEFKGRDGLLVCRNKESDIITWYPPFFDSLELIAPLSIQRNGLPSIELKVARVKKFKGF